MRSDGEVVINMKLNTKTFEKQIEEVEYELRQIEYELSHTKELKLDQRTIKEYTKKAETLNNKLIDLRKRQEELNSNNFFGNIGNSLNGVVKKVVKWGLAVFGVRSAYMAVRRAASTISQYNDEINADLQYIQYALASAIEPIIRAIIDLAYKLLNVINSISVAMFNYNLFQNASVDKFKKMNAGANQLKKTLAGFDEMNILNDSSTSGGGGTPTFDLNTEFDPEEGQKFKSFWEDIIKFWEEDWEKALGNVGGNWSTFYDGILYIGEGAYNFLKGITEAIGGLWDILVGVFTGDVEKMSQGWQRFLQGLKDLLISVLDTIVGLLLTVLGTVKGIFLDVVNWIYKSVIKPIGDFFANIWNGIVNGARNAWQGVKNVFSPIVSFFSNIVDKIFGFFRNIGVSVGNVISSAFKGVVNGVLNAIENILNTPIRAINSLIDIINAIPGINLGRLGEFNLPRLAKGGIVNMPGRGVNYGGANIGERGPEAVVPLTDSQQMDLLGQAIARHMVVNLTNINQMNGRTISRELQRIQNDNDFAYNR